MIKDYKDLRVWQDGIALAKNVYLITAAFPKDEIYGLSSQLKRAAVSVSSNIAEGSKRKSTKELIHFLHIADGSLAELETQLIIAIEIGFIKRESLTTLFDDIDKLARSLRKLQHPLQEKSRVTSHESRVTPP